MVSIHAPARGATGLVHQRRVLRDVSIHAPARGATCVAASIRKHRVVSIHAPARGATRDHCQAPGDCCRFNPRARTGRDPITVPLLTGGTFQSTRPHGARRGFTLRHRPFLRFQSTRPHGARHQSCARRYPGSLVSIHAPARGATFKPRDSAASLSFQSTRPHGARRPHVAQLIERSRFQSTRPHGARPLPCIAWYMPGFRFNPRARTGRDGPLNTTDQISAVSIHAPARGATLSWCASDDPAMFQSTRPHGARPICTGSCRGTSKFQSTRPHGARRLLHSLQEVLNVFQSTRPHGARRHAYNPAVPLQKKLRHREPARSVPESRQGPRQTQ